MRVDVYVPLLVSALFGLGVRPLARRLPPATATRLLVAAGVALALGWGWALALLAWSALGQLSLVAAGRWSAVVLHADDPVAIPVAWAAAVTLLAVATTAAAVTLRRIHATLLAWRLAARLRPAVDDLVVLPDANPLAYAVPGRPGRIVVSVGMLRALDADERRALLAHERAHLAHRHELWVTAARLAAGADPLLAALPAAVTLLVERWADEEAAAAVADRALTGRAICRAGLATLHARPPTVTLAAASAHVRARLDALAAAPPRPRRGLVTLVTAVLMLTVVAAADAGRDTERLFEAGMHAYGILHG